MSEASATDGKFHLSLEGDGLSLERDVSPQQAANIVAIVMGDSSSPTGAAAAPTTSPRTSQSNTASRSAKKAKKASSPGLVRDLSFHPSGKVSFAEFVADKKPTSHFDRQIVSVYWLVHELALPDSVTADHVNTAYTEAGWKRPSDLRNSLQITSSKTGWLDTSDMHAIKLTARGEDEVRYKLPRRKD